MASYNMFHTGQGIYGSPIVPRSLNDKKLPENPKIMNPAIMRRNSGITDWEPGKKNEDLLIGVSS